MSLAISYCKEIARELKLIPVYRPGAEVKPGDIIQFNEKNIWGKSKPVGDFTKIGTLSDLGIQLETETDANGTLDSYVYGSKGAVNVSFQADANAAEIGKGKLTIGFSKSGATYLSALDCRETRFKSLFTLEDQLAPFKNKHKWDNYFIVVSVTVAEKAIIMQSSTTTATLEIQGEVKNLTPTNVALRDLNASIGVKTEKYSEASFIKDWSNQVPVFFKLVQFRKKFFGDFDLDTYADSSDGVDEDNDRPKSFTLTQIDPAELVDA